jgi:hypothetical protein
VLQASPRRRRKQPNSQHRESASGLSQEEKEATLPQHWESASGLSQEEKENASGLSQEEKEATLNTK